MTRGFIGIGIYQPKKLVNVEGTGGLLRNAHAFGADFTFVIGKRYKQTKENISKAQKHVPLWEFDTFEDFMRAKPANTALIGIEFPGKTKISNFCPPERSIYLLGSEDGGLPPEMIEACKTTVEIPTKFSLNVANSSSIVLYNHFSQRGSRCNL